MTAPLAFALSLIGFAALALAMHRHHQQSFGRRPSRKARLLMRVAGATGLGSSFVVCVAGGGWAVGPVLWFGLLSAAGLVVVLLLAYRRRLVG